MKTDTYSIKTSNPSANSISRDRIIETRKMLVHAVFASALILAVASGT